MIQSMTGYGSAEVAADGVSYALEIRSVNHRYLKLTIKLPDYLQYLETDVDKQLRGKLARGSAVFALRTRTDPAADQKAINVDVLQQYVTLLSSVSMPKGVEATIDLAAVAQLPGVCEGPILDEETRAHHAKIVAELTDRVLDQVVEMRRREGEALHVDLKLCCDAIAGQLDKIAKRAPRVIEEYHERLRQRIAVLTQAAQLQLDADTLAKEVAVFADRADISEEITRLRSHLEQFERICQQNETAGRTLDFLSQELLREANTIASKSNDAAIARSVVEIKRWIDRLKEQVQNVE